MVRTFSGFQKSRSFHFKGVLEITGNQMQKLVFDQPDDVGEGEVDHPNCFTPQEHQRIECGVSPSYDESENQQTERETSDPDDEPSVSSRTGAANPPGNPPSDTRPEMDQMKEKFSKLLLGEDMSGGGKGVSSALALSNAITNLAASVFGEQRRLEPMPQERKARWRREIGWLLSVTDHIVEFVSSTQKSSDGSDMEIMVTRQRNDLLMNIPALRKLDALLIDCLDNFRDQNEFYYVSKGDKESKEGSRKDDKWWLPTVKVPPAGLSEAARKFLLLQKESVNQVLKAAMAINAQVLSEMDIPESYIDSLPKNGKTSLGDLIYKSITVEFFDPEDFLSTMDMSTEHKVLDLKNRIEASIIIWKRKLHKDGKSTWGSAVSLEKRELFEERAETILLLIKLRFPGLPQSSLDINKIQYNRDVGQSILESYSRIIESLAYTVLSQIDDVLYADSIAQNPSLAESNDCFSFRRRSPSISITEETGRPSSAEMETSMTLSDFMGWNIDQKMFSIKKNKSVGSIDELLEDGSNEDISKHENYSSPKLRFSSYIDKLGHLGASRSPRPRD